MCGIAGFTNFAPGDHDILAGMLEDLRHRGPEGASSVVRGGIALGHTHLAFTDLSAAGEQPMENSGHILTFNGEIFNHRELGREETMEPRSGSDAEVLLHLLQAIGLAALPRLNGFFAIAYLDPCRGKLYLIRDRFGVKPLYYSDSGGRFAFASEIRPLRRLMTFKPEEPTLRHNLIGNWTQGTKTGIEGVYRVLPGCHVEYDLRTGRVSTGRWFSLEDLRDDGLRNELQSLDLPGISARTEEILRGSVHRRAGGEAPLATLCSGGLDSALVTAMLARDRPGIPAFCVHYPELPEWSEFPWARQAGDHLSKDVQPVEIDSARWRSLFVRTAVSFEYPLWHESSVAIAAIAEDLQRCGIKGVLGGEGADELFGGYDYKYTAQREAFRTWIGAGRPVPTGDPAERVDDPILTDLYGPYASDKEDTLYRREIHAAAARAAVGIPTPEHDLEAILATELHLFLTIVLCRLDRSLMQFGIEGREPYLDQELVRLAFNIPLRLKTHPQGKGVLREIAGNYLPPAVIGRKKRGFSVNPALFLSNSMNPRFLPEARLQDHLRIPKRQWRNAVADLRGRSLLRVAGAEIWFRSIFLDQGLSRIEGEFWRD